MTLIWHPPLTATPSCCGVTLFRTGPLTLCWVVFIQAEMSLSGALVASVWVIVGHFRWLLYEWSEQAAGEGAAEPLRHVAVKEEHTELSERVLCLSSVQVVEATFEEAFQVPWPESASADANKNLHHVNHLTESCKVDGLHASRPWG